MANKNYKEIVEAKIKQAPSLVAALESVAAMYGIPSENIIVDDRANGISVQGDMIYTPDRPNPSVNTKAIVCAIGAVLDNISQRIDEKLTAYQTKNIEDGIRVSTQRTADPSKGTVVGRFFDSNGGEIIAYSSGLVDMDKTPEALAKVNELRASKQIPDIQPDEAPSEKPSGYFTDDDDIMKDVPMTDPSQVNPEEFKNDVATQIHESAKMIDLYDRLHCSIHMGYDLLQHQGFDFVLPVTGVVQEAAADSLSDSMSGGSKKSSDNESKGSKPEGPPKALSGIQHMKFDNTKILEAIEWFNKAYAQATGTNFEDDDKPEPKPMEIPDPNDPTKTKTVYTVPAPKKQEGKINMDKFMKLPEWKMGLKCLEEQFDCRLHVIWDPKQSTNMGTYFTYDQKFKDVTISKSKGFQLNGQKIKIDLDGRILDKVTIRMENKLFGQKLISMLLHEIFHNVVRMLRCYDDEIIAVLSSTMMLASSTRSVKTRRILFTNYVDHLKTITGEKMSRSAKRKMIKQLLSISAIQYNKNAIEAYKNAIDSSKHPDVVDKYIAKLEKEIAKETKRMEMRAKPGVKIFNKIMIWTGLALLIPGWLLLNGAVAAVGGLILIGMACSPTTGMDINDFQDYMKWYLTHPDKEEYYCDLFAGIYNLPVTFLLGGGWNGKTSRMMNDEKVKRLAEAEKTMYQLSFEQWYPTDSERCYAGYRIAKNALESGMVVDPSIKEYLEWIVDNYKNIEAANIKENYNAHTFNPEECENLDAHIQRIIDEGDVTVTESAQ